MRNLLRTVQYRAMDAIKIDAAMRERYERDGYVAIPRLLEPHEVEPLRDALRDVMARLLTDARDGKAKYRPPKPGGTGNYDGALVSRVGSRVELLTEPGYDPLGGAGGVDADAALDHIRKIAWYENEHPLFAELIDSPRVRGIAAQLIGEDVSMFQTMALVKPPLIGSEKPWHQDNAYFKYAPLESVCGFWLALDDASRENGCMHVLPGWHRRGGFRHVHTNDCQILPDRVHGAEAVAVALPPGGAMFFSGMLPHQTPPNRSPYRRRALQFHYRGVSTRVVDQAEYDRLFAEPDGTPASCAAARAEATEAAEARAT
jgi:phytanoyl-CoA hydroxylase